MKNNQALRTGGRPSEEGSFIYPFEDPRGVPFVKFA